MKKDAKLKLHLPAAASLNLTGMNAAVIGGTGGIGRALAQKLAAQGAHVIVVGKTFRDRSVHGIEFMKADLSLMDEARRVADTLQTATLDLVVFTTGVMAGPKREVTGDGIERDLAVSYLNRFVILDRIAPRLGTARSNKRMKARVFSIGYPGSGQIADVDDLNSERTYKKMRAHSNTVAGNEVLVLDAAGRFPHIEVFGLNPGVVKTNIRANFFKSKALLKIVEALTSFMTLRPEVYAERLTPLLVSPELNSRSGAMFDNKAEAILPSPQSTETVYANALMAASKAIADRASARENAS